MDLDCCSSPVQRAQFDELQTAWRHQCTADIKGNSSSFKISKISRSGNDFYRASFPLLSVSPTESESSFTSHGSCRICVPSLNMCFTTNKLQPLNIVGNIFDGTKLSRPLTIQDYISILIDNDKYIDSELATMITNIKSLTARYRRLNETDKPRADASGQMKWILGCVHHLLQLTLDNKTEPKGPPESSPVPPNTSIHRKQDSDLIARGILSSNSMQSNHPKPEEPPSTLARLLNGNGNHAVLHNGTRNAPSPTALFNSQAAEFPNNSSKVQTTIFSISLLTAFSWSIGERHLTQSRNSSSATHRIHQKIQLRFVSSSPCIEPDWFFLLASQSQVRISIGIPSQSRARWRWSIARCVQTGMIESRVWSCDLRYVIRNRMQSWVNYLNWKLSKTNI